MRGTDDNLEENMKHQILIPQVNNDKVPRGSAMIEAGRDQARVYHNPRLSFEECCERAVSYRGQLMELDFPVEAIASYDQQSGQIHARNQRRLMGWVGRRRAIQNQSRIEAEVAEKRGRARRLAQQGRYAEALLQDRRMGF